MGRKSRLKAARRSAHTASTAGVPLGGAGAEPSSMTELDVGGTRVAVFDAPGAQSMPAGVLRSAAERNAASRANAGAENQKT